MSIRVLPTGVPNIVHYKNFVSPKEAKELQRKAVEEAAKKERIERLQTQAHIAAQRLQEGNI